MFKKEITFKDLDDNPVTETFYFNLSKIELIDLDSSRPEGFSAMMQKILAAEDKAAMIKAVEQIVLMAYGVKSEDGRRFIKNDELRAEFQQSDAYSELVFEILSNDKAADEFIRGIMPSDLVAKMEMQKSLPNA